MAVKAGLKAIGVLASCDKSTDGEDNDEHFEFPGPPPPEMSAEYAEVLRNDVVADARNCVAGCRASGQRRDDLSNVITAGNLAGEFGTPPGLANHVLLREMEIRWSTTLLMIDRLLEMYPVCRLFIITSTTV